MATLSKRTKRYSSNAPSVQGSRRASSWQWASSSVQSGDRLFQRQNASEFPPLPSPVSSTINARPVPVPFISTLAAEDGADKRPAQWHIVDFPSLTTAEKSALGKSPKITRTDFDIRKEDLLRFSKDFKLSRPIPEDLIPILAKDEEKQKLIVEKAKVEAKAALGQQIAALTLLETPETTLAQEAKKSLLHLEKDFNPFRHSKVGNATQIPTFWPYNGKRYATIRPMIPPTHATPGPTLPNPILPNYGMPPQQSPQPQPPYPMIHYPQYSYNTAPHGQQPMMLPPASSFIPGYHMQPVPYPYHMPASDPSTYGPPSSKPTISSTLHHMPEPPSYGLTSPPKSEPRGPGTKPPSHLIPPGFNHPTRNASFAITPARVSFVPQLSIDSSELQRLMEQRRPNDLTGRVNIDHSQDIHIGGFSLVNKGNMEGRVVAIKRLKVKQNEWDIKKWEDKFERQLNREINVWAALSHPHILEFLGFSTGFGKYKVMVSPWCQFGTANVYLRSRSNVDGKEGLRLVTEVNEGLIYLHELGIIHGDLKPENVLIDDDHHARLCDFGLVRLHDWQGPAGMTTTSPYTGSARYKAPELFATRDNPKPEATMAGDIYALGCIALEFVKLRQPYHDAEYQHTMEQEIRNGKPPANQPPSQDLTEADTVLWELMNQCWTRLYEQRPTAKSAVEKLRRVELIMNRDMYYMAQGW